MVGAAGAAGRRYLLGMTQTSNDWPLVDPKDDGIRPAGKPDQCFYCRQRVGNPHALDCVIVEKLIEMRVEATVNGRVYLGVWRLKEPHYWTKESSEFHKNESSWCAGSLMRERDSGSVTWEDGLVVWDELAKVGDCLCEALNFKFLRVVDATPTRERR